VHALARDSRSGAWTMIDQAIVSLGNFGTAIVLARCFEQQGRLEEYGAFWMLMELMLLLNAMQAALAVFPLTVHGAAVEAPALAKMAWRSLLLTVLVSPVFVVALVLTSVFAHLPIRFALAAGAAVICWQLQETTRRALMAHLRFRAAVIGDAASYVGQICVIVILAYRGNLTLETVFEAIALTSALGTLIQSVQLGLHPSGRDDMSLRHFGAYLRQCWKTGHWVLYANLAGFFNGVLFNWALAYFVGFTTLAIYYALLNLLRLANPLSFVVASLITPSAARAYACEGIPAAKMAMWRSSILGMIGLAPYLLVLMIAPSWCISMVYGSESEYLAYASVVQIMALTMAMVYVSFASGAMLNAVQRTREGFVGQVIYAASFVFIAIPLAWQWGLVGAAMGCLIASTLRTIIYTFYVYRLGRVEQPLVYTPLPA
jgi:O-antigen/teichoic acid export membrane protein